MSKCIYCNSQINKISFMSLIYQEDLLCPECRRMLRIDRKRIKFDNLFIETFYDYDSLFKSLLIQYKECCDEALADVFLFLLSDYINYKYHDYKIVFVPSSNKKIIKRGFNHLDLIFRNVKLERLDGLKMIKDFCQEGKNFEQRKMMINNYIYTGQSAKKVLIVDDVLTSGSSIRGVYNAIKPYSSKIKALCLARKENAFIKKYKCV